MFDINRFVVWCSTCGNERLSFPPQREPLSNREVRRFPLSRATVVFARHVLPPPARRDGFCLRSNRRRQDVHNVWSRAGYRLRPWPGWRPPSSGEQREATRRRQQRDRRPGTEIHAVPLPADLRAALNGDDADTRFVLRDLQRGRVRPPHAAEPPAAPGTRHPTAHRFAFLTPRHWKMGARPETSEGTDCCCWWLVKFFSPEHDSNPIIFFCMASMLYVRCGTT